MPAASAPVLIERALLLGDDGAPDPGRIEQLVNFQRQGRRVVLVAFQPRRWRPTRRSVDRDLALQQQLHRLISQAGAELDGVIYLQGGLFTRDRSRRDRLAGLAARYGRKAGDLTLIAAEEELLGVVVRAGGRALAVAGEDRVEGSETVRDFAGALAKIPGNAPE